jgi:hypothetical protein
VVNFVGHKDEVMSLGEIGHALQFCAGPDPSAGIVGRAEDDHLLGARHLGIPVVEIHLVAALDVGHLAFHDLAASGVNHPCEGVIDRREKDHAIARRREGIDAHRRPVHQTVGREDPFGIDLPAVPRVHPPPDRGQILAVVTEIAVYPVIKHLLKRILHHLRRAKVHVCHPHRDPGIARHTIKRLHLVPLCTVGVPAVDDLVKTHGLAP